MAVRVFHSPDNLSEAAALARDSQYTAKFLAGGTDLLVWARSNPESEIECISLKNIDDLNGIAELSSRQLYIGAMTSHAEITSHPIIAKEFSALMHSAELVGGPATRNMGTIGGNVCNASPAADTIPPLLAYGAHVVVWRDGSEISMDLNEFFTGPGQTVLQAGDIVKGIIVDRDPHLDVLYHKLGVRKSMEIGLVNVCVAIRFDDQQRCNLVRIVLGAVGPTVFRATSAESVLIGERVITPLIEEAAKAAMLAASPISDVRTNEDYRRDMVFVLVRRLLNTLCEQGRK